MSNFLRNLQKFRRPNWTVVIRNLPKFWRSILIVLIPLVLLPLPIIDGTLMTRCAYVGIIMAFYWMLELLPLPVTSLIPVALFPPLGIMATDEVTKCYMEDTCMLYIGGLMVALAIEECNLHRRVALKALKLVGTSPRMLLVGFMLPTAVLSMWISNTASSAMMIPILEAVLSEVLTDHTDPESGSGSTKGPKPQISAKNMRAMLAMSICMSANIGGTATTIGTGPNLVLLANIEQDKYKGQPLSFGTWLAFAFPQMLLCLFLTWIYLQLYYLPLPLKNPFKKQDDETVRLAEMEAQNQKKVSRLIAQKCHELGGWSFKEIQVSFVFLFMVLLWFFRSPGFFTGWSDALGGPGSKDATPAILMSLFLFILPSNPNFLALFRSTDDGAASVEPSPSLITWNFVEKRMPWGIILLFGGGFALAAGSDSSGLSDWIGDQLAHLESLDKRLILLILCLLACGLTQVASNVTTATIIIPIVLNLSQRLELNPIYLALPPTLVCSFAFMLPVSTAPNAIAFGPSGLTTLEMAKVGFAVTVITLGVTFLCIETYGVPLFDLDVYPDWMPDKNSTVHT